VVREDLRDPEVEELHGAAAVDLRDEDVLGLHVAVSHLVAMRDRERFCDRRQQLERLVEGHPSAPGRPSLGEEPSQGPPLEPLEDEVRHPLAGRGGDSADVERLHDAARELREPVENPALVLQPRQKRGAIVLGELARELQALDGDGLTETGVVAAVDDAEAARPDERVDPILLRDRGAAEAEGVVCATLGFGGDLGHDVGARGNVRNLPAPRRQA